MLPLKLEALLSSCPKLFCSPELNGVWQLLLCGLLCLEGVKGPSFSGLGDSAGRASLIAGLCELSSEGIDAGGNIFLQ